MAGNGRGRWPRRSAAALGAVGLVLVLGAGSCDDKGLGDAPVGEQHETPRQVWVNADSFPNISAWCIGPNGIYTTTRDAPPAVVVDDPNCEEGGALAGE